MELESVINFRQVAGYPLSQGGRLKSGMLYRSGALELVNAAEAAWLTETLNLTTVLDLRHPEELEALSPHALANRVVRLSLLPEDSSQRALIEEMNGLYGSGATPGRYLHYLNIAGPKLARAFALLAQERTYPVLIHCVAGKDRTGVLVALLMDLLGASEADIAREYGMSNAATDRLMAYLNASGQKLKGTEEEIRARLATPPEHMAAFVRLLREQHGGAAGYLERQNVARETLDAVRGLLIHA